MSLTKESRPVAQQLWRDYLTRKYNHAYTFATLLSLGANLVHGFPTTKIRIAKQNVATGCPKRAKVIIITMSHNTSHIQGIIYTTQRCPSPPTLCNQKNDANHQHMYNRKRHITHISGSHGRQRDALTDKSVIISKDQAWQNLHKGLEMSTVRASLACWS